MTDVTHDHPVRGRFHAWFLSSTEGIVERIHGDRKRRLFSDLRGRIVELGPGTGANCPHYPPGSSIIGIEPNLRMHARLRQNASDHDLDFEIRGLSGESIDVETESADVLVCTLVLCSVDDPGQVVSEAIRVLKPGGRFLFIEHVAAPPGDWLRPVQNAVQPPWTWWFEGCRPNRDTGALLRDAGFTTLEVEDFRVRSVFFHVAPHIAGVAIK